MRGVLSFLVISSLLIGCGGGPISLRGRVVDHRGTAVAKAEVATIPETDIVVTNRSGFFVLQQQLNSVGETEPISPGVYRIQVRKFGFQDLNFEVTVEDGPTKVADLILQPRTPDLGEDLAPSVTEERETQADEGSVPKSGI